MKLYKLETTGLMNNDIEIISYPKTNDRAFMLEKIRENYTCYNQASYELKKDLIIVDEAIRSCVQYVMNNSEDINIAHFKLVQFINQVRSASGLIIQSWIKKSNNEDTIIYSVDKPKVKVMKGLWGNKAA